MTGQTTGRTAPSARDLGLADSLRELADLASEVADGCEAAITAYADSALDALARGRKLLFCGNGGSAADAQHLAAEYVVRMSRDRRALPAVALTTDTSVLTACANDRGYEEVFARQVQALGRPGDLLVLHSTSGDSPNLVRAARVAGASGVRTVGVLARGGGQPAAPGRDRGGFADPRVFPGRRRSSLRSGTSSAGMSRRACSATEPQVPAGRRQA